jgi:TRAP-type mannitol/chloroaromatic compound transport system permease small subunit
MSLGSRAASRRLNPWARWIAVVGFLGMLVAAFITVLDALLRKLANQPIEAWDDMTQLVFAVAIVAAFPAGLLQGHNITIRFLGAGLGNRASHWLELFGAFLTFAFIAGVAWQFVVLVGQLQANNDTTMTAEILTWPWWAVATVIMLFCVPIQAVVLYGNFRRAADGGGPGGTIDPGDGASQAGEV